MSSQTAHLTIHGNEVQLASVDSRVDLTGAKYLLVGLTDDSREQRNAVENAGVSILSCEGTRNGVFTYLCYSSATDLGPLKNVSAVQWLDRYPASAKIDRDLQDNIDFLLRGAGGGGGSSGSGGEASAPPAGLPSIAVDVQIHLHAEETRTTTTTKALADGLVRDELITDQQTTCYKSVINTTVDSGKLIEIAKRDVVRVIIATPRGAEDNLVGGQIIAAEAPRLAMDYETSFDGTGEIIAVVDTGFDNGEMWTEAEGSAHPAFRKDTLCQMFSAHKTDFPDAKDLLDSKGHGTHVAGSVLGSSQRESSMAPPGGGRIRGTAPGANLITMNTVNAATGKWFDGDTETLFVKPFEAGALIFNNSWGQKLKPDGTPYGYIYAEPIDAFIWATDVFMCWSAGNTKEEASTDAEWQVGAERLAKNVLTVGATQSSRPVKVTGPPQTWYEYLVGEPRGDPFGMCAWSNGGFFKGERFKPDVVAPGTTILSARSRKLAPGTNVTKGGHSTDDNYTFLSGTSMATPLVAGCGAVLRQALKAIFQKLPEKAAKDYFGGREPGGAMLKALIINGAVPMGSGDVPNVLWGFGRVNLQASLGHLPNDPEEGFQGRSVGVAQGALKEGGVWTTSFVLPAPPDGGETTSLTGEVLLPRCKITMAYIDRKGEDTQAKVHLSVRHDESATVRYGNMGTGPAPDKKNNVQQVVWAAMRPGKYTISVVCTKTIYAVDKVKFGVSWYMEKGVDVAGVA